MDPGTGNGFPWTMDAENCETLTVEAIDWPFLKSQRDHDCSSPDNSADHYEIVVSNVDDGLHHFSKFNQLRALKAFNVL